MNMKTTIQTKSIHRNNNAKPCNNFCNDLKPKPTNKIIVPKPTNKIIVTSENFLTLAWRKKTLGF